MRRKKEGILTRTRECLVLIPSKKSCWEIHLTFSKCQRRYSDSQKIFDVLHTALHNTIVIPSLIYTPSSTILRHYRAHNSSFCIFDTSFVKSTMTVISVWERKKERKKWIKSWRATARAVVSTSHEFLETSSSSLLSLFSTSSSLPSQLPLFVLPYFRVVN